MASSSSQEGSGLLVENTAQDVYDILAPVSTIRDSVNHDWVAVSPGGGMGQDLISYNAQNTAYEFALPQILTVTKDAYMVAEGAILYGTTNPVAAYDPATAITHCTVQNSALSLFNKIDVKHGGVVAQTITDPAQIAAIMKVMSPYDEGKAESENAFTYLNRGLTYDGATGREFTFPEIAAGTPGADNSGGTGLALVPLSVRIANASKGSANDTIASVVVTKNETSYDESFEKRCKYTGGKSSFFLKFNLDVIGLFGYRDMATFLNNTTLKFYRNSNDGILENRDAGHNIVNAPTATSYYFQLKNLTLYLHQVTPTIEKMALLMEGIDKNKEQVIAYRSIDKHVFTLTQGATTKCTGNVTVGMRPSLIIGAIHNPAAKSHLTWNNHGANSFEIKLDSKAVLAEPLQINSWTAPAARRLYELYRQATGYPIPPISYGQFITNYCFWVYDSSKSITGMYELNNKQTKIDIAATNTSGWSANLECQTYIFYDRMYTISGPNDKLTPVY